MEFWDTYLLMIPFVFGIIVGSFLNVVVYRLHTNKSLSGRSHCTSCGVTLTWYELVPLVSYVALKGRCRSCSARIPSRYMLVELVTGLLFVAAFLAMSGIVELVFALVLIGLLVVIAVYDIRHTIIPNELVLIALVLALFSSVWDVEQMTFMAPTLGALIGGVVAGGFFALLHFMSRGRWMGLGDAKLAFPLGVILGIPLVWSMIVLSFWIGAFISLCILVVVYIREYLSFPKRGVVNYPRYFTMKSEVPFAPFLVGAFVLVFLYEVNIFSSVEYLLQWLIL